MLAKYFVDKFIDQKETIKQMSTKLELIQWNSKKFFIEKYIFEGLKGSRRFGNVLKSDSIAKNALGR